MSVSPKTCARCGVPIPVEEFETGAALEHGQAYYCGQCKRLALRAPKSPPSRRRRAVGKSPDSRVGRARAPVEGDRPARGWRRGLWIGGLAGAAAIGVVMVLLLRGGEDRPAAAEPERAVADVPDPRAARRQDVALKALENYVSKHPEKLERIEVYVERARKKMQDPSRLQKVERIWDEARDRARGTLMPRLEAALKKSKGYVEGLDFDLALRALEAAPAALKGTEAWERVEEMREEIERYDRARRAVQPAMEKASGLSKEERYKEALDVLDDPPRGEYLGTPLEEAMEDLREKLEKGRADAEAAAKLEEEVAELKTLVDELATPESRRYDEALKELQGRLAKVAGTPLEGEVRALLEQVSKTFADDMTAIAGTKGEPLIGKNVLFWNIQEGQTGAWKPAPDEDPPQLIGETLGGATIGYRNDKWTDYLVEFEVFIYWGDLLFAMRLGEDKGALQYSAVPVEVKSRSWQKLRYLVLGSTFYRLDPSTGQPVAIEAKHQGPGRGSGAIGFVLKGNGSIKLRSATLWPLSK